MSGRPREPAHHAGMAALSLGALGIVFGDIGTSPLYALQTVFAADHHAIRPTEESVYGVISLARNHPQVVSDSQEIPIQRGSARDDGHPSTGSIRLTEAVAKVWPDPPVNDDDPRRHR